MTISSLNRIMVLKKHWQRSKKQSFGKYYSSDKACQFSVVKGTPWPSYLEKTDEKITIDKTDNLQEIYKQTSLTFYTSSDVSKQCWEEKIIQT